MSLLRNVALAAGVTLGLAASALAQGMMMHQPHIPGEFNPVVGSGAEYKITGKDGEAHDWTYAVVGKESVDGAEGYWLEMRTEGPEGKMIMKQLVVPRAGSTPEIKRMIMQAPGRPPMEMPAQMMGMGMRHHEEHAQEAPHGLGEKVGSESVTVPAGTFETEHYRYTSEGGETSDAWVSTKVAPYGLIKSTSAGTTMVLEKVLEHETSQIQGEPQKMEFPGMPHP